MIITADIEAVEKAKALHIRRIKNIFGDKTFTTRERLKAIESTFNLFCQELGL